MSRSRDNPDPRLIVNGPRQWKQAPMLSDPNNDETESMCLCIALFYFELKIHVSCGHGDFCGTNRHANS
jgi:hypothetical protein